MEQQQLHRVHLTEEHFHLARRFMVMNRLRSTRVAVEKMIEMVSEWEDERDSSPEKEGLQAGRRR